MNYKNVNTGVVITSQEYFQLPYEVRRNFVSTSSSTTPRRGDNSSSDLTSFVTSAAIGYATDSALLGGILGGDMGGGIVGDIFNGGDLFD